MNDINNEVEECLKNLEKTYPSIIKYLLLFISISDKYTDIFSKLQEYETIQYEYVNFYDTLDRVKEFLKTIRPEYVDVFENCLNDGTFEFVDLNDGIEHLDYAVCEEDEKRAKINVPINSTSLDGSSIVHEFFHYVNCMMADKKLIESREIFTEFISAYYELRYDKFVSDKYYGQDFFKKELLCKIDILFDNANFILLAGSVLDSYINTSSASKKNIMYVDQIRKIYKPIITEIEKFKRSEEFYEVLDSFDECIFYMLGILLAIYNIQNPIIGDVKADYLNRNFKNLSVEEILNMFITNKNEYKYWILSCLFTYYTYLETEYIDVNEVLSILGISLEEYETILKQYLMDGELNEKTNSYSRANRCRKN